ncbi:MAG TPA: fused MFS/spermidine synthase [Povalibacter sp.]|nr:fused MFS/spermidine synthase [Povalibacter sp.]
MSKDIPWLEFDSPWFFNPGTVRMPYPPQNRTAAEIAQQLVRGGLTHPYVLQTESERRLHFSGDAVQSVMRLDEPDALACAYTRKMMAFLLFNPRPRSIVMVGLGGGSLAKFCYRNLHRARICAVEIDERVIAMREEFLMPADDHRFRIVCDDGAHFISQLAERIDIVLVDAFDAVGIAPTLATTDFYAQVAARLSSRGVLVMNFSGEPQRYASHIDRILVAFGGAALLVPVLAEDNLLLFAFKGALSLPKVAAYESRARRLQSRLALEFPRFLRRIRQGHILVRASASNVAKPHPHARRSLARP